MIEQPVVAFSDPTATAPPKWPKDLPPAWVVFAAPLEHLTAHPVSEERRAKGQVFKRVEYDFAHQGAPLFEFWRPAASRRLEGDFLSLRQPIPGYRDTGNRAADFAAWWAPFVDEGSKDVERWERVRRAMEMGSCKVVLRWAEPVPREISERTKTLRSYSRAKAAEDKKLVPEEVLEDKKAAPPDETPRMLTRGQARRRKAQGLGDPVHAVLGDCRVRKSKPKRSPRK